MEQMLYMDMCMPLFYHLITSLKILSEIWALSLKASVLIEILTLLADMVQTLDMLVQDIQYMLGLVLNSHFEVLSHMPYLSLHV
jgi:hypothetical protein